MEQKRRFGFLPFGTVRGEVTCFLQVLDAATRQPRFAGDIRFTGEMGVGWVGYGNAARLMPLSPMAEKHFIDGIIDGLTDLFVETAEKACRGIQGKKSRKSS